MMQIFFKGAKEMNRNRVSVGTLPPYLGRKIGNCFSTGVKSQNREWFTESPGEAAATFASNPFDHRGYNRDDWRRRAERTQKISQFGAILGSCCMHLVTYEVQIRERAHKKQTRIVSGYRC